MQRRSKPTLAAGAPTTTAGPDRGAAVFAALAQGLRKPLQPKAVKAPRLARKLKALIAPKAGEAGGVGRMRKHFQSRTDRPAKKSRAGFKKLNF